MAEATPAPAAPTPPAPLTLDLNQYADAVNQAYYNQAVCVIATSNGGEADLALKGSFMVWDSDHLAYWERGLNETLAAIRVNPRVAVLVRPKGAPPMRFYGSATVVEDPAQREAVYNRVIPEEQGRDPDKKGIAVLINVDRIRQGAQMVKR
jgi:pyridoxamine 5'-phosphate oxidase-like protein